MVYHYRKKNDLLRISKLLETMNVLFKLEDLLNDQSEDLSVKIQLLENRKKTPEKARSNRPGGILDELNDDSFESISDENSEGNATNLREEKCELCGKVSFIVGQLPSHYNHPVY